MTIIEQQFMETIIRELPKIRKALESINSNLENLNETLEVSNEHTSDELL